MRVNEVMTRDVVTVAPDTWVKQAARLMASHGYAALPVLDEDALLVGIIAEADLLRDRIPPDPRRHLRRDGEAFPRLLGLRARGVMTTDVRTVSPVADVADVARLLVDHHLRSVPVVDDGRLVGIVSRRDLLGVPLVTERNVDREA